METTLLNIIVICLFLHAYGRNHTCKLIIFNSTARATVLKYMFRTRPQNHGLRCRNVRCLIESCRAIRSTSDGVKYKLKKYAQIQENGQAGLKLLYLTSSKRDPPNIGLPAFPRSLFLSSAERTSARLSRSVTPSLRNTSVK